MPDAKLIKYGFIHDKTQANAFLKSSGMKSSPDAGDDMFYWQFDGTIDGKMIADIEISGHTYSITGSLGASKHGCYGCLGTSKSNTSFDFVDKKKVSESSEIWPTITSSATTAKMTVSTFTGEDDSYPQQLKQVNGLDDKPVKAVSMSLDTKKNVQIEIKEPKMSGNNAQNVGIGKPKVDGAIWVAPTSTTVPTDGTTELNPAFKCVGFISEDGLTNSTSRESETMKAWGSVTVRKSQTSYEDTWKFTMIETNEEVMKVVYGDKNVSKNEPSGLTVLHNEQELGDHAYVVETIIGQTAEGKDRIKRIVIPVGTITETDDIEYKDDSLLGYGVTITGLPDSKGNCAYEYIAETQASPIALSMDESTTVYKKPVA